MHERLLKLCGDRIEVLYQRRRGVPAESAWQRLRAELTLISGTEAEQQFLIAAEIAAHCRRQGWPVWEAGVGASSITLFLLELSLADPIENRLPFERYFFPDRGETVDLLLKTLDRYAEPLGQVIAKAGATSWIRLGNTDPLEAVPFLVEQDLRHQGKAPDWGREPTDWPIIWESLDSLDADRDSQPDIYQLDLANVFEARQAWQPGSPAQLAAITAIACQAGSEELNLFTWAQREEITAEILKPWTRDTGGVLIFQEQIMAVLQEVGGIDLAAGYRAVKELAKKKVSTIDQIEAQFLTGATQRGHDNGQAWSAFDNIRHAGMRGLHCQAYHVAHAVTTFRALWLKARYHKLYQLHVPPEVDSQQLE
jgi:DNA polymerase III alpha subunit